jgi:hypothetical protein
MPAGHSVRGGALDLIPGDCAQLAAAKTDIAQDVIVEIFDAQKQRAIAKVALDRPEQSCNQHGRFPKNDALDASALLLVPPPHIDRVNEPLCLG